jgi:hypothetical protein
MLLQLYFTSSWSSSTLVAREGHSQKHRPRFVWFRTWKEEVVDLPPHYAYAYCGTVSREDDMPRNKRASTLSWRGFSVSITALYGLRSCRLQPRWRMSKRRGRITEGILLEWDSPKPKKMILGGKHNILNRWPHDLAIRYILNTGIRPEPYTNQQDSVPILRRIGNHVPAGDAENGSETQWP